ncbi:TOMM precursor leader peptide-binding protein [Micromonospora sp. PLK6-60]|uniref:TOMM precursor leader peptide-binding protein n=1 Tax=Micromonospora sp. PLK6-60 TaxID=2873383 RepID=UPI001CA60415|nr:TOMM precursor leader peptide-binding protein [Micromonospora sp. PLK6-60]MBY8872557.1 TOMM precursor leader peptide-binding protein [Micromonospora sp. PLK6-60]
MDLQQDADRILDMRPKLRHDVVFLDAPAGAYLRGPDSAFLIRGRSAFRWLSSLSPYLDGGHTLAQLCTGLAAEQRRTVVSLVRALVDRGFAKDAQGRGDLPEPVARRFATQIEFVGHFADDPARRFQRFHTTRVALGGRGETLRAAVAGLLRNGCVELDVHPDDAPETYRDAFRAEVTELRAEGVDAEVRVHSGPLDPAAADALLYCTDATGLGRLHELARVAQRGGPPLVPVYWDVDRAVLGPAVTAGQSPCWLCAQLRLTESAGPATGASFWRQLALGPGVATPTVLPDVTARMLGNAAAFELFRIRTGALPPDTGAAVVLLDPATLESARERVLPHPACPACRDVEVAAPADDPADDEETYRRAEALVSEHAGVFTRFVDDPLEQAPLKTARLRIPGPTGPREITAFAVDTVMNARLNAYRTAVRDHVARHAAPPGAVTGTASELREQGLHPVPWGELDAAGATAPDDPHRAVDWVPATVLADGTTVHVPAALALPASAANAPGHAERTTAGAAVGATRAELIDRGLASALAYRALTSALRGRSALVRLGEDELVADDETALVIKAAHRFGRPIEAFTLLGAAPAHAVLALAGAPDDDAPMWTLGADLDPTAARLAATRDLVGLIQVRHFEDSDADLGDPLLVGLDPATLAGVAGPGPVPAPAATDRAAVLAELTTRGVDALLVETTTRDIRASGAFHSGVVLLRDRPAAQ